MRLIKLFLVLVLLPATLFAQTPSETSAPPLTVEAAKERLLQARPDLPISSITQSALTGYFEVVMQGGMILYMNDQAEYFIAGDLWYVSPGRLTNATEMARVEKRKEMLATLDEKDMLVFAPAPENIKTTITVFTDIDCGYCRKLHQEVPELNRMGIAVRYLAYPRAGIGSMSYQKAVAAWCADDPLEAMTLAKAGQDIELKTCPNPVAAQLAMVDQLGLSGTPAIFYEDGTLQPGYLPAPELARRLGLN